MPSWKNFTQTENTRDKSNKSKGSIAIGNGAKPCSL